MQVAIYSRLLKPEHIPIAQSLFDALARRKVHLFIAQPYYDSFGDRIHIQNPYATFTGYHDLKRLDIDFFITLGGDGTILDAITIVKDKRVPIMGINLGRLGFLAMIEKHRIELAIQSLEQNTYVLDKRSILYLETSEPIFGDTNFGLNDFTIVKRDTSSMVIIHTYVNGEFLNSYWADGIIVATPTGSTGYSLSCGGPIIFPDSGNFVITPVAPHNLNVRPILLPDDAVISFEIEGRARNFLCTLDSRHRVITSSYQLTVRKADFNAQLVRFPDRNFLYMIRQKLHWGTDSRN